MPRERCIAAGSFLRGARRRVVRAQAGAAVLVALVPGALLAAERYALTFANAPAAVRVAPDGREVLLEFSGPLRDGEAAAAAKTLGALLEGYAEGYGAVRFRLTTPAHAQINAKTVVITPNPQPEDKPEDRRRLALLEARAEADAGDLEGARVRLTKLAIDSPGDMEPLLTLAAAESGAGRWQHALGLYDGVRQLFPEATDITRDRDALATLHAPLIRPEIGATFGPNGERAQTVTLGGDLPLGETWRARFSEQTTHETIRGLRRPFSSTVADYNAVKVLGTVGLAHDWDRPIGTTRLNLFAAPATVGAEIKHEITTRYGDTTIGALYHQPYWGTVMAFAANARRDQIGVSQLVKFPGQWQVQAGAGVIRYGIPGHDTVASGASALAGFSKGLPAEWLPLDGMALRLGYRLEAEYLSHAAAAPTASGLLPLLDTRAREIHSVYAESTLPVGPGTVTALLGYAIDRYGGGGPQALLRYTSGADGDRLVFAAEAGIEPSLDVQPRTLFHLGGYAVWRFGGT